MRIENLKEQVNMIVASTNQDITQENANQDGKSPMGMMGHLAATLSKEAARDLIDPEVLEAFDEGFFHIHDFDFYLTGTTTCCQIPLGQLLETGFTVGNCYMRTPSNINSAMGLTAITMQANQNQQHGGQSISSLDYDLAPYVRKTYEKKIKHLSQFLTGEALEAAAMAGTEENTNQAAEALVHNLNSMMCRNGMQVPFVSLNFGLDTSWEGRMVSKALLLAQEKGMGDGSTPIFPILVMKIKKGINVLPGEPNYDIYLQGLQCLSKRLFPNFQFIDTPFNLDGFDINDPKTHVSTMGCRTRVYGDIHGPNQSESRGNLSFTTLNLPLIAQEAKLANKDIFEQLDEYTDLVIKQLLDRLNYQKSMDKENFKFLYGEGLWKGSKEHTGTKVDTLLDTGSLSLGFIGLAEMLVILNGKHHGESEESQKFGLDIIKHLRKRMDDAAVEYNLNFSLLATPAESYCGKALLKFKNKYGVIDGVSDKEFFTNSNHVPVYYDITAQDKIKIEAPYHELTNAGHIMYIELDGEAAKNLEALDDIVKHMMANQVGYGSINHPIDRCPECNYASIIPEECPKCGNTEIARIRRITGYLVGDMKKWNTFKTAEESNRVKHANN